MSTPFGPEPLVFKIVGKMFALLGHLHGQPVVSLKCEPGLMLRASFPQITPGYHLNKQHWVTLPLDGSLPPELVLELIDGAYDLIASASKKRTKAVALAAGSGRPCSGKLANRSVDRPRNDRRATFRR